VKNISTRSVATWPVVLEELLLFNFGHDPPAQQGVLLTPAQCRNIAGISMNVHIPGRLDAIADVSSSPSMKET